MGPFFARTPEAAERLFLALLAKAGRGGGVLPVYLDAPQDNPEAAARATCHGLTPVFECGRMYHRGIAPSWRAELVYTASRALN